MESLKQKGGAVRSGVLRAMALVGFMVASMFALAGAAQASVNYNAPIQQAKDEGLAVLSNNILLLLALPVAWVGYRVARKVIAKIG